jgi:hypothetical protein
MSADIVQFRVFTNSGKGLIARPIIPRNVVAIKSMIETISYEVFKQGTLDPSVSGTLDPNDVMYETPQTWKYDKDGYTFLWETDGSLWPDKDSKYNIVVTFVTTAAYGSKPFILVWQANTKSPSGR